MSARRSVGLVGLAGQLGRGLSGVRLDPDELRAIGKGGCDGSLDRGFVVFRRRGHVDERDVNALRLGDPGHEAVRAAVCPISNDRQTRRTDIADRHDGPAAPRDLLDRRRRGSRAARERDRRRLLALRDRSVELERCELDLECVTVRVAGARVVMQADGHAGPGLGERRRERDRRDDRARPGIVRTAGVDGASREAQARSLAVRRASAVGGEVDLDVPHRAVTGLKQSNGTRWRSQRTGKTQSERAVCRNGARARLRLQTVAGGAETRFSP